MYSLKTQTPIPMNATYGPTGLQGMAFAHEKKRFSLRAWRLVGILSTWILGALMLRVRILAWRLACVVLTKPLLLRAPGSSLVSV